jgi:hypothetical protein
MIQLMKEVVIGLCHVVVGMVGSNQHDEGLNRGWNLKVNWNQDNKAG